jgi:hypothetical protein
MSIIYPIYSTNVRIVAASLLLLTLAACATSGTPRVRTEGACARNQMLICETFATERRCRCGDSTRLGLSTVGFGPVAW